MNVDFFVLAFEMFAVLPKEFGVIIVTLLVYLYYFNKFKVKLANFYCFVKAAEACLQL